METLQNKFSSKTKMLSLAVVLISLSVSTTATEPRKCYWCGPLAEQVHKSTRAPSCNEPSIHVTACDPGYSHCAVVATSPPYTESRLCVKLYQDECYSLYCNSTKIWRMTCPCLGDLCNGPNTQREKEAFSILTKLVNESQNTRSKRTLITSKFISNKNNDINNKSNETQSNTTTNEDNETTETTIAQTIETNNKNTVTSFKINENNTNVIKVEVTATIHEADQIQNDNQNTTTLKIIETLQPDIIISTVSTTQVTPIVKDEKSLTTHLPYLSKEPSSTETLAQSDSANQNVLETKVTKISTQKIEIPESTTFKSQTMDIMLSNTQVTTNVKHEETTNVYLPHPSMESPTAEAQTKSVSLIRKAIETEVTEMPVKNTLQAIVQESTSHKTQATNNIISTVTTKPVTEPIKHEESSSMHLPHLTKEIPAAEALQQNTSVQEKGTEPTITESSSKATTVNTMHETKTPENTTHKKNTATQIKNPILTLVLGVLLHRSI